jgi:hypothetical protein
MTAIHTSVFKKLMDHVNMLNFNNKLIWKVLKNAWKPEVEYEKSSGNQRYCDRPALVDHMAKG